jgi:hypothetical protein
VFLMNFMHVINAQNMEYIKLTMYVFPRVVTYCTRYRITSFMALNVIFHQQSPSDMPGTSTHKQCW